MKFPFNEALTIRWQFKQGKITREEALQKLGFILDTEDDAETYGPLLRLSDVCKTLRKWVTLKTDPNTEDGRRWYNIWSEVDLAISKSNLLARLFFTEEDERVEKCPEHKGRWSGCDWKEGGVGPCACTTHSNVTGWLPTDPRFADRTEWLKRMEGLFPAKAPCGHRVKAEHDVVDSEHGVTCSWCYDNWREFEGGIREFTQAAQEPPVYDKDLIMKPYKKPTGLDAIP